MIISGFASALSGLTTGVGLNSRNDKNILAKFEFTSRQLKLQQVKWLSMPTRKLQLIRCCGLGILP